MASVLGVCALIGAAGFAHAEPIPYTQSATVSFRTLPAVADPKPLNARVHYVGGYELTAHGTDMLVGLSDLQIEPDGETLHVEANSDWGWIVRFDLKPDGKGGMADSLLEIDQLRGTDGEPFADKTFGDAEDLAYDPVTHDRFVSFEGQQRIIRYRAPQTFKGQGEVLPVTGLPLFPANQGMEGLTYIREKDGDSLLIGVESGGFWRCPVKTWACTEVHGPAVPGFLYMLTSLAVLDYDDPQRDHDILTLYRYYDPFTGPRNVLRLTRLEGDQLVKVEELARIAPPLPYDNYEGVAALRTATGYRIYLVCDGLHAGDKPKILVYDWDM
ncbi:esterase-like activity of phytase family protein [Asticcacaulis solisilvae]|uniref:esterase-like activity of phytase family protein n=1 Tax=Asticcacaulis solisilvae TaxID=1217274 RepID=UPI003FD7062E